MIHYHGGPITPIKSAIAVWARGHAMISFANPGQVELAAEVSQSFVIDNGAFSFFQAGKGDVDERAYSDFIEFWRWHPGFDWCVIPDKIDGTAQENDRLIERWSFPQSMSVPVYHLHEPISRLQNLVGGWHRVALGSSGEYWEIGSDKWWSRMNEVMLSICDDLGRPKCKLHGLRMLNPTIFSHLPLASGDAVTAGINPGYEKRWTGPYVPKSKTVRALVMTDRIEFHASAATYNRTMGVQMNWDLVG